MRLDGTTLSLTPDPLGGRTVTITIDAREISRQPFTSAEDARRIVESAPVITLEGSVTGTAA